jgi:hypothetical protein
VVEAVAIGLLGLLTAGLLRSHAEILKRLYELGLAEDLAAARGRSAPERDPPIPSQFTPENARVHDISGVSPYGEAIAVGLAGSLYDTLLAFLSSNCITCAPFWESLRAGELPGLPEPSRLVVVTKGPEDESVSRVRELAHPHVTVVMATEAWSSYGVPGAPYFVLVNGPQAIVAGEGTGPNWEHVRDLMAQASGDAAISNQRGRRWMRGQDRADRVESELLVAGIVPGHPSLYPTRFQPPNSGTERRR